MITEHLRQVMERLGQLPGAVQERFATEIEGDLDREEAQGTQERNVAHLAHRAQEEPEVFPGYPLGVNPLEKYMGQLVDRFPHLSDDDVLAMEAAGEIPGERPGESPDVDAK